MDKGKPVSFDLLRINKGMKKICRCNPPHYELSVKIELLCVEIAERLWIHLRQCCQSQDIMSN